MRLLVTHLVITRTICLIGILFCAASATAQQSTGNIAGRVVDEQDAGVAGATVTARNVDTGFVREVTSDANGLYLLSALPVGMYERRRRADRARPLRARVASS